MVVEPADMPIIKVFTPENADEDARKNMASVEATLSSPEKKAALTSVLRNSGAKALLIVPNQDEESPQKFLMYVVEGQRPMTGFALGRLAKEASQILSVEEPVSFTLKSGAAANFARDHDIGAGGENPVSKIFSELESRKTGIVNA